jgi:hypothetical protein
MPAQYQPSDPQATRPHPQTTPAATHAPPAAIPAAAPLPGLVAQRRPGDRGNGPTRQAALLQVQQTQGNRAGQRLIQRRAAVQRVKKNQAADNARVRLGDDERPSKTSMDAIKKYAFNSKKKSTASWRTLLRTVKAQEEGWDAIEDHVIHGEAGPKGFHTKSDADEANCEGVGAKNPANASGSSPYKQWIRMKDDRTVDNLKISTFFPDNWPKDKIRAAALLRTASADHQVQAPFSLVANDGTVYPNTPLANPAKPSLAVANA